MTNQTIKSNCAASSECAERAFVMFTAQSFEDGTHPQYCAEHAKILIKAQWDKEVRTKHNLVPLYSNE